MGEPSMNDAQCRALEFYYQQIRDGSSSSNSGNSVTTGGSSKSSSSAPFSPTQAVGGAVPAVVSKTSPVTASSSSSASKNNNSSNLVVAAAVPTVPSPAAITESDAALNSITSQEPQESLQEAWAKRLKRVCDRDRKNKTSGATKLNVEPPLFWREIKDFRTLRAEHGAGDFKILPPPDPEITAVVSEEDESKSNNISQLAMFRQIYFFPNSSAATTCNNSSTDNKDSVRVSVLCAVSLLPEGKEVVEKGDKVIKAIVSLRNGIPTSPSGTSGTSTSTIGTTIIPAVMHPNVGEKQWLVAHFTLPKQIPSHIDLGFGLQLVNT